GAVTRQGAVAEKNTLGDGSSEARAHQMSVEVNVAETEYMGDSLTFIDCPGSVEFSFEAEGVLPGVDLAIVVAEADEKKIPALQVILRNLEDKGIPRVLFLNKVDKSEGSVRQVLEALQRASDVPLVLRHIPIWSNDVVEGFIDLALERAHVYREHAPSEVIDLSDDQKVRESEARFKMLETLADYDDQLMEELLEEIEPSRDRIFQDLVQEMRAGAICPVLIGSADQSHGIGRLLKLIRHEAPGIEATRERLGVTDEDDAIVQVMKTMHTAHGGKLSICRVLSGSLGDGAELFGPEGPAGRVSGVFRIMGQQAVKRDAAVLGETVGFGKLEDAATGWTLSTAESPDQLVSLVAPDPVLGAAVTSAERKDEVKLSSAMTKVQEEDPSLRIIHNQDTGETVVEGQGEMHLRVSLERLTGKYGIAVNTEEPSIPYKESIRSATSVRGRHKKQSGGHGQFGDVVLEIKPLPRGSGFQFSNTITGGVVPRNYIPSVEGGVTEYLAKGPLGFPVVDISVTLSDGSYHSVDSSDQAFRMAAQIGMREGMPTCKPVLLEPVLKVELFVPSEATPRVNGIVSQRRGQILGFDARAGWKGWDVVEAMIPQAEIRDLIVELRSATAGVGTFANRFDHLAQLSGKLADQVVEQANAKAA
ncbi:MAG: elongation factor G, partial [Alphaproteobacteria bacterium]